MLLTKTKTIEILRRDAGYIIEEAVRVFESLPKEKNGKRPKVRLADVQRVIRRVSAPTPVSVQLPERKRKTDYTKIKRKF